MEKHTPVDLVTLESSSGPASTHAPGAPGSDITTAAAVVDEKVQDLGQNLELDSTPPPRITKRSRFASAWRLLMNRASKVVNPSRRKRRDGSTDSGLHGSEDGDDSDNEDSAPEPLEGKSLYIFDVDSPIRNKLHRILSHTLADVFMFILFIVNLVFLILKIDSPPGKDTVWGGHWTDYGLLAIFIIYTFEIAARIIVSGLILFPREGERFRRLFMPTAGAHSMPTNIEPILEIKPQHPFLRHSFNRMDMVALVCYWIDFFLMMGRVEGVYIFKALAALRTLRLINMTLQKWTPLHSLKKSIPLLLNIALSIAFLFLLFSIIGVVAFKGSYTRRCVLATDETVVLEEQFCGSYYKEVGSREKLSYITLEGVQSPTSPKGYTCAYGYICKDTGEYFENDLSFDHIGVAMVQVYILMTAQTWTDIMYKIMDAEHGASSIYFILVILIMNFWILNLFVAVIIESESMSDDDEEDTKNALESTDVDEARDGAETRFKKEQLRKMEFFWVLAIIADLVFQCQPQYKSRTGDILSYENAELWFTVLFLVDIGIRFTVWPAHPKFFHSPKNNFDLFLAVVTTIIQIPAIRYSDTYTYLSVFQVMRIYRPIIYIQSLKDLIQRVVGRWQSMLGLLFFIAMFLVVAAVMAGLLFREIVSQDNSMNFSDFYVSYLGMYQIFSGENWTDILYNVMEVNMPWHQIFVGTVFVIAFYSFANFVLLNMIVAIISDNFGRESDVEKHNEQIKGYAATRLLHDEKERLLVSDLHTYLQQHKEPVGVHSYPPEQVNTVSQELTCEFFFDDTELFHDTFKGQDKGSKKKTVFRHRPGCPGHALPKNTDDGGLWEWFRHRSLLVFGPHNKIRQFCQKFVTPGKGYRVDGLKDDRRWSRIFNSFIAMAILGSVIVAMVTTPVWRFRLDQDDSAYRQSVIAVTDYVFTAIFVGEFILRIIADGFILTPDAYLRSLWNQVDFIVLLAMCARVIWRLMGWSRTSLFFRSLRALRAIRLITLSTYIKDTFHAVLIAGFPQLLDATMLCMALLVPFAIYGMRLFSGEFFKCNDEGESIMGLNDCMGTFQHKDFNITIPRYWANPPDYSFNNFWASFLLLLEIVSQDGWVDVMETARNSAGVGMQPRQDASRYNGIFFVVFNMAGGYFVTSLFVAIVIETYSRRTGTAFMSADQLRWKNLRQFLRGIRISKSLRTAPEDPIKAFYYRLVSHKNGWFAWLLTGVTILIGITLATENLHHGNGEMVKCWFTFFFLLFYVFEIYANLRGIGWHAYRVKKWNLYNGGMSILALVATLLRLGGLDYQVLVQVQKLILTGILMRLVPRSESLNRLVMTMFASLDHILKLLAAWLIVFAVYGIMFMEVFGLTSYGEGETGRANFRDIGSTLLMMVRMSTGEGWSGLMHDYAKEKPLCVKSSNYLLTDCGSTPLAYTLFISFNIISMYIFTNMFVAEVMQKFSY
ncbi:calcium channel protein, partial [Mortierella sp. GBA43]